MKESIRMVIERKKEKVEGVLLMEEMLRAVLKEVREEVMCVMALAEEAGGWEQVIEKEARPLEEEQEKKEEEEE